MLYIKMHLFGVIKESTWETTRNTQDWVYGSYSGKLRNTVWVTSVHGLCWKFWCWMGHGWKRGWRDKMLRIQLTWAISYPVLILYYALNHLQPPNQSVTSMWTTSQYSMQTEVSIIKNKRISYPKRL